jgi:predicted dehydrogenase
MNPVRIGIVGLGKNTRDRHVPGFRAIEAVEIVSVCNRSRESSERAAKQFAIPKTFDAWEELVRDDDIDAVMIGTWPNVHCSITLAALEHGKHVLTEARMASSLQEARRMLDAAQAHPQLVTQIVPSPFGLRAGVHLREMLADGYIGELREFAVRGAGGDFADTDSPLHWRQSAELSGINMLALGILHETLIRWIPDPVRVFASTATFRPGATRPDSVHILTDLPGGARGVYHLSGIAHHGSGFAIDLYGTKGTLKYDLATDRLLAGKSTDGGLHEVAVPAHEQGSWRVEADFVDAIRGGDRPALTDFATGVRYMEFTEAVERSALDSVPVSLPFSS